MLAKVDLNTIGQRGSSGNYGTDTFEARDFIRTGLAITLVAMLLLVVFALTYWPWMGYMTKSI